MYNIYLYYDRDYVITANRKVIWLEVVQNTLRNQEKVGRDQVVVEVKTDSIERVSQGQDQGVTQKWRMIRKESQSQLVGLKVILDLIPILDLIQYLNQVVSNLINIMIDHDHIHL